MCWLRCGGVCSSPTKGSRLLESKRGKDRNFKHVVVGVKSILDELEIRSVVNINDFY